MKLSPRPALAPPDLVARVFLDHEDTLRAHAVALLRAQDVSRHTAQALTLSDDVLQNARLAALRNPQHFTGLTTDEAQLNKAKTFVWNAVRTERGRVYGLRRVMRHVSDYDRPDGEAQSSDEFLDSVVAAPNDLDDDLAAARAEWVASLPREIDRLTITLNDMGYEGQDLADQIAAHIGRPYSYAAATARLCRLQARLARELRPLFRP